METPPPLPPTTASEDKTAAILAYITIIGFIIAIVLNGQKKTKLAGYHLRQALGIYLTATALAIVLAITVVGMIALPLLWIGTLVLVVLGLISAAKGETKPVPLLGEKYQKWLGTAFD